MKYKIIKSTFKKIHSNRSNHNTILKRQKGIDDAFLFTNNITVPFKLYIAYVRVYMTLCSSRK